MQTSAATPPESQQVIPAQASTQNSSYPPPSNSITAGPSSVAKGFALFMILISVLAILSTFLPWLSGNGESANGWKIREALTDSGLYSAGSILVVVGAGVSLLVAIFLLSAASKNSAVNRVGLGLVFLIMGLMMAGGLGATYNDLSDYFGRDAVSEILAVGWYVGTLCGFGIALAGVLSFFIKPLSNSK